MKKYRVASGSTANANGYVTAAVDGGTGVVLGVTTTVVLHVGSTIDAATGSATPTSDTGPVTTVIINPGAVYRMLLVKGATGGALDLLTESGGGSKIANTITTGETAPNSPDMNEGIIACISGANKGQVRKITSVSATIATNIEGWVNNNAIGDLFIMAGTFPGDGPLAAVNLTTNLANHRADITGATGVEMRVVEYQFDFSDVTNARNGSYSFARFGDSIWTQIATVEA